MRKRETEGREARLARTGSAVAGEGWGCQEDKDDQGGGRASRE